MNLLKCTIRTGTWVRVGTACQMAGTVQAVATVPTALTTVPKTAFGEGLAPCARALGDARRARTTRVGARSAVCAGAADRPRLRPASGKTAHVRACAPASSRPSLDLRGPSSGLPFAQVRAATRLRPDGLGGAGSGPGSRRPACPMAGLPNTGRGVCGSHPWQGRTMGRWRTARMVGAAWCVVVPVCVTTAPGRWPCRRQPGAVGGRGGAPRGAGGCPSGGVGRRWSPERDSCPAGVRRKIEICTCM